MSQPKYFAFYLDIIEHDSWSGSSHDGYILFLSEEDSQEFVKKQYSKRNNKEKTPEYYVNYEKGGYIPIGEETYKNLEEKKVLNLSKKEDFLK